MLNPRALIRSASRFVRWLALNYMERESIMQYATLREKIRAEKAIRAERDSGFAALTAAAHAAGIKAGRECRPIPMIVSTASGIAIECVDDGACGFAWIEFPGNTAFGRWAKKQGLARSHYPSGLCIWVSEFGQSIDRKEAYSVAYARVLRDAGVKAFAGSRLD